MKTVCQLLHSLNIGGAEILAARLGRKLSSPERRFVYVCLDEGGVMERSLRQEGFCVEILHRKPGFDRECVRNIARLWKKYDVDIVQAHQYTPYFYAMAARGFFSGNPPVVFTEHGRFFPDPPNWKHKIYNALLVRPKDRMIMVGRSVGEAVVRNEGIARRRIEVIYNGVSEERFAQNRMTEMEKATLREQLGVGDRPVVLFVARLDPIKDHPTAIRAMREITHPSDPILLIAGGGPEYARLQTQIQRDGLESRVRLLGERSDVARLLQIARIFLLTSVSEGIPLTILEAMASGVPVVATNVGGIPEVVCDGQTGLLAAAGDFRKIAENISEILSDAQKAEQLAQNAKKRFAERFTERLRLAEYEKVLFS
ncbi:MAG: glycosyltransferase [Planctomycetia bacterium]|nr:glycosyltransferase [Planctomycetia bacterium]